ncbi:MAG TPA: phosphatidate cytidylyltransferase [Aldersonia sp.]
MRNEGSPQSGADATARAPDVGAAGNVAAGSAAEPTKKQSRAGRNLPAALAVGFGLGITLIVVLVFVPKVFIPIVAVAMAIATWEVATRLSEADVHIPRIPILLGGQAVIWLSWPWGTTGVLGAFGATALVCMIWRLFQGGWHAPPRNFLRDTAVGLFVLTWIPLFAAFAMLTVLADDGGMRILTFMITVVCSDVGGYAAGVLFGKHPMVPAISPKKSWEGFAGSLVACIVGGLLTVTLLLQGSVIAGIVLGVVLVFVATLGDLIESQVKRELGIKDMGKLLPGHGGIMDRVDSMLPAAVVSWLVFTALL